MEMKPIIFYKTTADFDNTGEVLIYKTLLENLREYGRVIVDDSPHIQPLFLTRIGIRREERLHTYTQKSFVAYIILSSVKNIFKRNPMYFATGVGEHVVGGGKDVVKNICSFFFLLFLRLCGLKVIRIGMSIRFNGKLASLSEYMLSKVVSYYYVRDGISLQNCKEIRVNASKAPDLSWGYHVEGHDIANGDSNLVIFSFRDYAQKYNEKYKSLLYDKIGALLGYICKDKGKQVLLTWQCDYDKAIATELFERFKNLGNIQLADDLITLENASKYYGKAAIVFTNRLHVMLLGYKFGALTVCLTDLKEHSKITGIFKEEQLDRQLLDIHSSDEEVCSSYDSLLKNMDSEWKRIHEVEKKNYTTLKNVFKAIFQKR